MTLISLEIEVWMEERQSLHPMIKYPSTLKLEDQADYFITMVGFSEDFIQSIPQN